MLKKEILDASKRLIECLLVLIAIPIALIWDKVFINFRWEFSAIFDAVFIITVVVYSIYSGATIFQSEKKDRAFEYLLSMPLTRMKIIIYKIFPRISILALMIIGLALFSGFKISLTNVLPLIFLFLISAFISFTMSSVIMGFIGVFVVYVVFHFTSRILAFIALKHNILSDMATGSLLIHLVSTFILLIPFGIAFWKTIKNLDVKPLKLQMQPYYYIALPSLFAIIIFLVLFYDNYKSWFLTR